MHLKTRTWCLLSLMCLAGAAYFWKYGDDVAARQRRELAPASAATNTNHAGLAPMRLFSRIPAGAAKFRPSRVGAAPLADATTNSVASSSSKTNRFPYRLSNTTKSIGALGRSETAILLRNALIETAEFGNVEVPEHLRAGADAGSYVVQAEGKITEAFRDRLDQAGAQIVAYIPNNAFLVRLSEDGVGLLTRHQEVRSIIPFEPYYKLGTDLLPFAVGQKPLAEGAWLRVTVFPGSDSQAQDAFAAAGTEVVTQEPSPFGTEFVLHPAADSLVALARMPEVQTIEQYHQRVVLSDLTRVAIGVSETGATNGNYLNLTGQGVMVNVNDTGIDATHPDLAGGVGSTFPGALSDLHGHGTLVAGLIAGSGAVSRSFTVTPQGSETNAIYSGMAPSARIFSLPLSYDPDVYRPVSETYLQRTAAQTNQGLRRASAPFISNNSWGYANANEYNSSSARFDAAVRDALPGGTNAQPGIYVFAAGNSGGGGTEGLDGNSDSVVSPATAKNVITVTAVESFRHITNQLIVTNIDIFTDVETTVTNKVFETFTDSDNQISDDASRGNVGYGQEGEFGRFKPDVAAPGGFIVGARNKDFSLVQWFQDRRLDTNSPLFKFLTDLNGPLGPYYRYEYVASSSMAAAAVSGTLALMQEFFEQRLPFQRRLTNSPAMMKALLINGARSLDTRYDFQVANSINYQGWGMIHLPNMITPVMLSSAATNWPVQLIDQNPTNAVATDQARSWTIGLSTNAIHAPLKVTLVWTDPPGNPNASIKLVNDLDLVVSNTVTHQVYIGNNILSGSVFTSANETNSLPGSDFVNNVENVIIADPADTNFVVSVIGRRVNVAAPSNYYVASRRTNDIVQDFALVISTGDLTLTNAVRVTPVSALQTVDTRGPTTMTNGVPLLQERVGANSPLMNLKNGATNQWSFYRFTNTYIPNESVSLTNGTNVAFITFLPPNLSVPRNYDSDIDLYVSKDEGLLTLNPAAVTNAFKSTQPGGTEAVIFTNAALGDVFFVAVKSEDQQGGEYQLTALSTDQPFEEDSNGSKILRGFPVNAIIPDGTARRPGGVTVLALGISSTQVRRVVVTNIVTHEQFGDLIGTLTHERVRAVLNNHRIAPDELTNLFMVYDDFTFGAPQANAINSDGPGSLNDFSGRPGNGVWQFTMVDDAHSHTGRVDLLTLRVDPLLSQDLGASGGPPIHITLEPKGYTNLSLTVPQAATNLILRVANLDQKINGYIRWKYPPTTNLFDKFQVFNPPGGELTLSIYDQPIPLLPGHYEIVMENPNTVSASFDVSYLVELGSGLDNARVLSPTNTLVVLDDAVTISTLDMKSDKQVTDLEVAVRIAHPRISDLVLTLISPQGTRLLLAENKGGLSARGYGNGFGSNLTYAVFTEDTNAHANLLPVKFASPPYSNVLGGGPTNLPIFTDGFELATNGVYRTNQALPQGWTVDKGSVTVHNESNPLGVVPYEGTNFVELDTTRTPGGILRTFETLPGKNYVLTFAYHRNPAAAQSAAHAISMYVGPPPATNAPIISDKFLAVPVLGWSTTDLVFTATTPVTAVELSALTSVGPLIDDVQIRDTIEFANSYVMPEESFDFIRGERAEGQWRLEIRDTRQGPLGGTAQLIDWQLRLKYGEPRGRAISLNESSVYSGILSTNQTNYFVFDVCQSARLLSAVLIGPKGRLSLLPDRFSYPTDEAARDEFVPLVNNIVPDPDEPDGFALFLLGNSTTNPAPLLPGRQMFFAVHNVDPTETNAYVLAVAVDRDTCNVLPSILRLTNDVPRTNVIAPVADLFQYYVYTASCTPGSLNLELTPQNGDVGMVVRRGPIPPLPDFLNFDYFSDIQGVTNEVITITTNSTPIALSASDDWYVGVFSRSTNAVLYSIRATETYSGVTNLIGTNIVTLTNGVPLTNTIAYCPQITNYFLLSVTNPATSVSFALSNLTQAVEFMIGFKDYPSATNFVYSNSIPATGSVQVVFTPTNTLPSLQGDWFARVVSRVPANVTVTILGEFVPGVVLDCDPIDPVLTGITTNEICWMWPTTPGHVYRFEGKTNITDPVWVVVDRVTGKGSSSSICVPFSSGLHFFQVVEECNPTPPGGDVVVEPVNYHSDGTNLCLNWASIIGLRYRVEQTTNVVAPTWSSVTNLVAVGTNTEVCFPIPLVTTFYQVIQEGGSSTNRPIITLTNNIAYTNSITASTNLDYYVFTVSTNAVAATFTLTPQDGDLELLLTQGLPLPDVVNFDYVSDAAGVTNEVIVVRTNSTPVALAPGDWYLAVRNQGSNTVSYTILASETLPSTGGGGTNEVPGVVFTPNAKGGCLTWTSVAGRSYRVESNPSIVGGTWTVLTNITATFTSTSYCFENTTTQFYRVMENAGTVEPPHTGGTNEVTAVTWQPTATGVCLTWPSVIGSVYRVESTTNIVGGPWGVLARVTATATNTTYCVTTNTTQFFRVFGDGGTVVEPPPTSGEVTNVTTQVTGGNVCFTWTSVSNQVYQIESTTNIVGGSWTLFQTIRATNTTTTLCVPIGSGQFFRVLIGGTVVEPEPVAIDPLVEPNGANGVCLTWTAEPGASYRVEGRDPGPDVTLFNSTGASPVGGISRQAYLLSNGVEVGDEINLAGTNLVLHEFEFEYSLGAGFSGNEGFILRFRDNDGTNGTPGTVITDSPLIALAGSVVGVNKVTLPGLVIPLTNHFTWTVEFSGIEAGEQVGVVATPSVTTGTSLPLVWKKATAAAWNSELIQSGQLPAFSAAFRGVSRDGTNWVTLTNTTATAVTNSFCLSNAVAGRFYRVFKDGGASTVTSTAPAFTAPAAVAGGNLRLAWQGSAGSSYELQSTADLLGAPVVWSTVTNIVATQAATTVTIPLNSSAPARFFRLIQR